MSASAGCTGTMGSSSSGPCQLFTAANAALEPLSVDSGRVALQRANGALVVRNTAGAVVRQFPSLAGVSRGAELMGNRVIALVPGKLRVFGLPGGQQVQRVRRVAGVSPSVVCAPPVNVIRPGSSERRAG